MIAAGPFYDFSLVYWKFLPGVLAQREVTDAISDAFQANGTQRFSQAKVTAAMQVLPAEDAVRTLAYLPTTGVQFPVVPPALPTGLVRLSDSNPASDGWCIDDPEWMG